MVCLHCRHKLSENGLHTRLRARASCGLCQSVAHHWQFALRHAAQCCLACLLWHQICRAVITLALKLCDGLDRWQQLVHANNAQACSRMQICFEAHGTRIGTCLKLITDNAAMVLPVPSDDRSAQQDIAAIVNLFLEERLGQPVALEHQAGPGALQLRSLPARIARVPVDASSWLRALDASADEAVAHALATSRAASGGNAAADVVAAGVAKAQASAGQGACGCAQHTGKPGGQQARSIGHDGSARHGNQAAGETASTLLLTRLHAAHGGAAGAVRTLPLTCKRCARRTWWQCFLRALLLTPEMPPLPPQTAATQPCTTAASVHSSMHSSDEAASADAQSCERGRQEAVCETRAFAASAQSGNEHAGGCRDGTSVSARQGHGTHHAAGTATLTAQPKAGWLGVVKHICWAGWLSVIMCSYYLRNLWIIYAATCAGVALAGIVGAEACAGSAAGARGRTLWNTYAALCLAAALALAAWALRLGLRCARQADVQTETRSLALRLHGDKAAVIQFDASEPPRWEAPEATLFEWSKDDIAAFKVRRPSACFCAQEAVMAICIGRRGCRRCRCIQRELPEHATVCMRSFCVARVEELYWGQCLGLSVTSQPAADLLVTMSKVSS